MDRLKEREPRLFRDRRQKPDLWTRMISIFGALSWLLMLPTLLLIDHARPQVETFFDRWLGLSVQADWDQTFFFQAFLLMLLILVLSGTGLLLNGMRRRRRQDSYRVNLILVFTLSLAGCLHYLWRFGF
ncbi:hypothetical protein [Marinospirillum sp.]|uniref:hypothetical protein n=1 Tax=Marinospirillum sp. TaxID=2183934 RepID=UPI003A872A45